MPPQCFWWLRHLFTMSLNRLCAVLISYTSEMIYHRGASLSEQRTDVIAQSRICHAQVDIYVSPKPTARTATVNVATYNPRANIVNPASMSGLWVGARVPSKNWHHNATMLAQWFSLWYSPLVLIYHASPSLTLQKTARESSSRAQMTKEFP